MDGDLLEFLLSLISKSIPLTTISSYIFAGSPDELVEKSANAYGLGSAKNNEP